MDDVLPLTDEKKRALASHAIWKLQDTKPPIITKQMFEAFFERTLPTPAELSDNLLQYVAERVDGRPGRPISINHNDDVRLLSVTGAVDLGDVLWAVRNLEQVAEHCIEPTARGRGQRRSAGKHAGRPQRRHRRAGVKHHAVERT